MTSNYRSVSLSFVSLNQSEIAMRLTDFSNYLWMRSVCVVNSLSRAESKGIKRIGVAHPFLSTFNRSLSFGYVNSRWLRFDFTLYRVRSISHFNTIIKDNHFKNKMPCKFKNRCFQGSVSEWYKREAYY